MWFKQATLFQFSKSFTLSQSALEDLLQPLAFSPCLPSFASSVGWVSPLGHAHQTLVYATKRFYMIALQFEEKILPATVVRQAVADKIADIEAKEARQVRGKEKQNIKDEMMQTLLPRAFTKKSVVMAYIDLEKQHLVLNTTNTSKAERFIAFFKRAIVPNEIHGIEVKKPVSLMTGWLKGDALPDDFVIGQACLLRDAQQEQRIIRCQQHDLFSKNIQAFLNEDCEVLQLAMTWKENVNFTLTGQFGFRRIQFQEGVLSLADADHAETPEQRFDADFVLMTELLSQLFSALLSTCQETVEAA